MNGKFKELFAPTIVLLVICLVATGLLTATYQKTKPIIDQKALEAAGSTRNEVLPEGDVFLPMEGITLVEGVTEVYEAENGAGIVCTATFKGFGGPVEIMVGISADGEITGIKVTNHSETPNLGTKAMTEEHLGQFIGATAITGSSSGEGTKIDVIGGATLSSNAIFDGVAASLLQYGVVNGASYEAPVELTPEEQFAAALAAVLPAGDSFEKVDTALAEGVMEVYKAANGAGFVAYTSGVGYAGEANPLKAVVGIDTNGAVTGVQVLEHQETNGIGTKAMDESYIGQFIGATAITRKASGEGTKIDVISGATFSSVGVYDCVKAAIQQYELTGGAF